MHDARNLTNAELALVTSHTSSRAYCADCHADLCLDNLRHCRDCGKIYCFAVHGTGCLDGHDCDQLLAIVAFLSPDAETAARSTGA